MKLVFEFQVRCVMSQSFSDPTPTSVDPSNSSTEIPAQVGSPDPTALSTPESVGLSDGSLGSSESPESTESTESNGATGSAQSIDPRYLAKPSDSYTKLAMRNMVRRKGTSLVHFGLTTLAVLALLIGVSYIFH